MIGPDGIDDDLVIGIEPDGAHARFHLAPLPHDERAGAAGLFGMRAAPDWCAVAVTCSGRARHLHDGTMLGSARALVVVDRLGGVASRLLLDDPDVDTDDPGPVLGLTVDALHRVLGLACPGEPPPAPLMALAVWSQQLILEVLDGHPVDWATAVALHPGEPSVPTDRARHRPGRATSTARTAAAPSGVPVSVEALVEATLRTAGTLSWERLHRRAIDGEPRLDLRPGEVEWMDPTLYARWVLGSLPDIELAADVLVAHGLADTAERVQRVADVVTEQVGHDPTRVNRT